MQEKEKVNDILPRLKNVKKSSGGWVARCPAHDDQHQSLSIGVGSGGKILLKCHANQGCTFEEIISRVGNPVNTGGGTKSVQKEIIKTYDYVDVDGTLLYQAVRTEPKGFFQRKPEGTGWSYKLEGVKRVLYRTPDLFALSDDSTIFLVEGEKDVDNLWDLGFHATTNVGGAGKWLQEYTDQLARFKRVVIIPDNDKPGREHARKVAEALRNFVAEIRILVLPNLPEKGDTSDWLKAGGLPDELDVLVEENSVLASEFPGESEDAVQPAVSPQVEEPRTFVGSDDAGWIEKAREGDPSDVPLERQLLGLVFKNNALAAHLLELGFAQYLYLQPHKHILSAMFSLYDRNWPIDQHTLAEELSKRGVLAIVGGMEYLNALKDNVDADPANVEHYVEVIKSKSKLRSLIALSDKMKSAAKGAAEDPEEITENVERTIFEINDSVNREGFQRVGSVVDRVIERAQELSASEAEISGIPTGFPELDRVLSGLQKTDAIVIAARPSMGKTGLAGNIAVNVAKAGFHVAIFSLEMAKDAIVSRMICSEAFVDSQRFRNGNLNPDEWARLAHATAVLDPLPIYIDDTPGISVLEMRAKARRLKSEQKQLDVIIVDYLQLMEGDGNRESRQQEISQISRQLKGLAKELNVALIELSQLNRAVESRPDKRPQLSDLRESGAVEQDADVVAFIYREEQYNRTDENKGLAELIIAKQRNGPTTTIHLAFLKEFTRFENILPAREERVYGQTSVGV
jgi:replicative DNA helicase